MLKPSHLASELNISELRVRHHLRKLHPHHKPYTRWEWSENGFEKELHNIREYRNNQATRREEQKQAREERQRAREEQKQQARKLKIVK